MKELDEIEKEIAKEVALDNRNKIVQAFSSMTETDGIANINELWILNRNMFPKKIKALPIAKKRFKW